MEGSNGIIVGDDKTKMEMEHEAHLVVAQAGVMAVTDARSYENATIFLLACKNKAREVKAYFEAGIARWHEGHKAELAKQDAAIQPFLNAAKTVDSEMGRWRATEARIQVERQRELAERERKLAEDMALNNAAAAHAEGDHAAAEAALNAPTVILAPPIPSNVPKIPGLRDRKDYKFEVFNASLLPRECLIQNDSYIGAVTRASKATAKIPGVRMWIVPSSVPTGR